MKTLIKSHARLSRWPSAAAYGALAQPSSPKATVKKVDAKAKKVTLMHEDLKEPRNARNDDGVPRPGRRHPGEAEGRCEQIEFVAERVNGKLTVTEVK